MSMIYINTATRRLVNSANRPLDAGLVFDFKTGCNLPFTLFDKCGKVLAYNGLAYLAANTIPGDSAGCIFYAEAQVAGGVGSFEVDTYTEAYLVKITQDDAEILLEIGIKDAAGGDVIALRDTALAMPRVYVPGLPPAKLADYYTRAETDNKFALKTEAATVNGLPGAVVLADASGIPFPVEGKTVKINAGGGTAYDYSQVTWPVAVDAARGRVRNLDSTTNELVFAEVQDIISARMLVVGNDPVVTGDIVIVPVVASNINFTDAEDLPATIVPIGLSLAWAEFALPVSKKFLKFRRDYTNQLDTLHDGGGTPLTAIIAKLGVR